eukprot:TRINITY_DN5325_c0_g1_i1.p1 TRINITY_DN5325_c0_g1~~TRINITY_DN5325_c0_g1_i1.p1  ORF type:complete len:98 (+),score=30.80 TRINITY_DN5325_c0_g1_i1:79-372(+)
MERKDKLELQLTTFKQREQYNDSLMSNYKEQLARMESAVLDLAQFHNKERMNWSAQMHEKESEINKLKMYLALLMNKRRRRAPNGSHVLCAEVVLVR